MSDRFVHKYDYDEMLEEILEYLHNWFPVRGESYTGTFRIENQQIALPFSFQPSYYRIQGSKKHDGLHRFEAVLFDDETFTGRVTALAIPHALIELSVEIMEWENDRDTKPNPMFQSESFGGYSRTLNRNSAGLPLSWKDVYRHKLNRWRKI